MTAPPDDVDPANPESSMIFGPDIPRAVTPVYSTPAPNAAITLYDDAVELTQGSHVYSARGTVKLEWLPSPRLLFYLHSDKDKDSGFDSFHLAPTEATLNLLTAQHVSKVIVTNVHYSFGEAPTAPPVAGRLFAADIGTPHALSQLVFHVVNFADYQGSPVRGLSVLWGGRADTHADGWHITLDTVESSKELFKQLSSTAGYAITHVGTLRTADGQPFDMEAADKLMEAFCVYLSFCKGCSLAPILYVGFDAADKQVFRRWNLQWHIRSWANHFSWFNDLTVEGLTDGFPRFLTLWRQDKWNEPLSLALHWYREANTSAGGVEGSVIMAQAAFELLSWNYLVIERKVLSEDGFQKLPAMDKLRLFLSDCDIPLPIPASLAALAAVASAENWSDGPHALVEYRNALVHPNPKKRSRILGNAPAFRVEAWLLTMWYFELAILRLFNYQGKYADRMIRGGFHGLQVRNVPWHQPIP